MENQVVKLYCCVDVLLDIQHTDFLHDHHIQQIFEFLAIIHQAF